MLVRASELRLLDVINVVDGRKLGYVYDVDVDVETGRIRALLVPGEGRRLVSLFGRRPDIAIPWKRVRKIGVDVILVHLPQTTEEHR
ncbi:MAG: YlmC/YmxH family sporulation protein [Firmicutes bacterium]|nr:YlmC/YmxH family sporulation protein [Bacillota bacterium]